MYTLLRENIKRTLGRPVPEDELEAFCNLFFYKSVDKKTALIEEHIVCKYLYFVNKGACYSGYTNEEGDRFAVQFAVEDYWITDQYSFFTGQKSIYRIETLEPCELLYFNRSHFDEACDRFSFADRYFRILMQNAYISMQYRLATTNSKEAELRYIEFNERFPRFAQRIPQYLIASYLGIKPPSLSRIRQKLAQQGC